MRFSTNPDRLDGFATVSRSRNGVHVVRHLLRGLDFSSMVKTMTYLVFGTKYWSKLEGSCSGYQRTDEYLLKIVILIVFLCLGSHLSMTFLL
jgi:hypothetical protein